MNKILVIRYKFIGDVLMTSVICNSLKQSFPNAQVDYMVHEISAPLFENHPFIDNVIAVTATERQSSWAYLKKVCAVAKRRYDIIIDASSIAKTECISLISRQTKYRIGRTKKWRGFSYTHKIAKAEEQGDKIAQRLGMLAPLKQAGYDIHYDDSMIIHLTETEKLKQREALVSQGVDLNRPLFVFSVSAKYTQKKWRADYMQAVAQYCLDNYGAQIILYAGDEREYHDIRCFHESLGWHADIYSRMKTNTIRDLAALFANCDMFIGNEGGPRHISQALNLPSVAIFSPSASRFHWLPNASEKFCGIEWQDVTTLNDMENVHYEYGDSLYFSLYNSITPNHVTSVIEQVVRKNLTI